MKTTYIKMFAGLGNQIFQYAYGKNLEQQGIKIKFILNKTYNKNGISFDFPECFVCDYKKILTPKSSLKLNLIKFWAKYIVRNWNTDFYQEYKIVDSLTNFKLIFKEQNNYQLSQIAKQISSCNAVSLHIRGGDYNESNVYSNICTSDYYTKAIEKILCEIMDPFFFIFTNDITFSKSIIHKIDKLQGKYCFVRDIQQYETKINIDNPSYDLFLMTQCKHNIIANSTFSWWGAYLNQNIDKIVISPSTWMNNNPEIISKLIPEKWIKV